MVTHKLGANRYLFLTTLMMICDFLGISDLRSRKFIIAIFLAVRTFATLLFIIRDALLYSHDKIISF